jgi:hypothetical protein
MPYRNILLEESAVSDLEKATGNTKIFRELFERFQTERVTQSDPKIS